MAEKEMNPSPERHWTSAFASPGMSSQQWEAEWKAYQASSPRYRDGAECPFVEDLLDLAHGHLSPERAAGVENHMTVCTYCREVVEFLRKPVQIRGSALEYLAREVSGLANRRRKHRAAKRPPSPPPPPPGEVKKPDDQPPPKDEQ